MSVIDSSALVAMLLNEPEAEKIARDILSSNERLLSAASFLETSIVIYASRKEEGVRDLDILIAKLHIKIMDVTEYQANLARKAYITYGKGIHKAALNFGDCFAYALAKELGQELIYKGNDFAQTDMLARNYA